MTEKTIPAKRKDKQILATREFDRYLVPPVDIYETGEGLRLICDLPGVSRDGVDVQIENDVLTIRGMVNHKTSGDLTFSEFGLMNYYRQFEISRELDREKIDANLNQGLLTINLKKVEKAKPKKISISVER